MEEAWALTVGLQPTPTCKRSWTAAGGHRRDFVIGCPLAAAAAAALLSCKIQTDRWIAPHLAIRALFDWGRWESWVTQPVHCTPLWPGSWLPAVERVGALSQLRFRGFGMCMMSVSRQDAVLLDDSLDACDVSMAWVVLSRAAESALADAYPDFCALPLDFHGRVRVGLCICLLFMGLRPLYLLLIEPAEASVLCHSGCVVPSSALG